MAALLFLGLCAWLGAGLYGQLRPRQRQITALCVTVSESLPLRGIAVRREQLLRSPLPLASSPSEGERVPAGALIARLPGGEELRSPGSALFFSDTDGFEHWSPELLEGLDAAGLQAMLDEEPRRQTGVRGRLVLGRDWLFAALCQQGREPEPGKVRLQFGTREESVPARLLRAENGLLLLRLSCGESEGLLSLRKTEARLILRELSGIALPPEAVHTDPEGDEYVNILTLHGPERRSVTILYREEGRWIADPEGGEDALRPGSTVLIDEREGS